MRACFHSIRSTVIAFATSINYSRRLERIHWLSRATVPLRYLHMSQVQNDVSESCLIWKPVDNWKLVWIQRHSITNECDLTRMNVLYNLQDVAIDVGVGLHTYMRSHARVSVNKQNFMHPENVSTHCSFTDHCPIWPTSFNWRVMRVSRTRLNINNIISLLMFICCKRKARFSIMD